MLFASAQYFFDCYKFNEFTFFAYNIFFRLSYKILIIHDFQ